MNKKLTLVHLFLLNQVVIALTVVSVIGFYGTYLFISEQDSIRQYMDPPLTREVERLRSDFIVLESNLKRLKSMMELFDVIPKEARLEKFRGIAAATIAPHSAQFNAYFALGPKWANKYLGRSSYVYTVFRDKSLEGTDKFDQPETFLADGFVNWRPLAEREKLRWNMSQGRPQINFSDFYLNHNSTDQVMFSTTLGVYEKGRLEAIVGIDTLASDIASRLEAFRLGKTGGLIIVDKLGRPVLPLLSKDLDLIGYRHPRQNSNVDFESLPKTSSMTFNIAEQTLQEFSGANGKTYVTYAKPVTGHAWHMVVFQERSEAYAGLYFRIFVFSFVALVGFALLSLMLWFTGKYVVRQDKEVLEELRESRDKAEAATRAKSLFLSTMSHEIRTPLNSMLGSSEMLVETSLSREQRSLLTSLQTAGDTLLSTLNNILDVSKFESGRVELESREFKLSALVKDVESIISVGTIKKGLEFVLDGPEADRLVVGDSLRLKQILMNLLGNALKFTDKGRIELEIRVSNSREPLKEIFTFKVKDTGIGIACENLEKVFSEFGQEDSSITRRFGGTGLGLNISRKIVKAMGGELLCLSKQQQGSEFYFSIQLQSKVIQTGASSKNENGNPMSAADHTPTKPLDEKIILIVDDMEENHTLLKAYLKKVSRLTIESAYNGFECLQKWESKKYDVIFMDVQMPHISGLDTIRRLREQERLGGLSRTPIIVVSANSFVEDIEKSLDAGADEHCGKPIRKSTMVDLVERYAFSGPVDSHDSTVNS